MMDELYKNTRFGEQASNFVYMNWHRSISWLGLHRRFFGAKSVHLFLFIVVNVFIGSLGVWMPLMTSLLLEEVRFSTQLSDVLAASGPYTFAIAYLAASSAYAAYDFLENRTSPNRKSKTVFATTAFVLIILCTLLSAFQTQISHLAAPHRESLTKPSLASGIPIVESKTPSESDGTPVNIALSSAEELQLGLVAFSILIGLVLYVLSRWDDADCSRMIEEYEKALTDAAQRLGQKARGKPNAYGNLRS